MLAPCELWVPVFELAATSVTFSPPASLFSHFFSFQNMFSLYGDVQIATCQESHRHWHQICRHSFHLSTDYYIVFVSTLVIGSKLNLISASTSCSTQNISKVGLIIGSAYKIFQEVTDSQILEACMPIYSSRYRNPKSVISVGHSSTKPTE